MKKKIPLIIHEKIEPYIYLKDILFRVKDKADTLLHLEDIDEGSDFYFSIKKIEGTGGRPIAYYEYSPGSEIFMSSKSGGIDIEKVNTVLEKWIGLLERYKKVNTLFDDTILNGFKDEFYTAFEIIEEDANIHAFNTDQILFLDSFFGKMQERLELGEYTESGVPEMIQEVIDDIQETRDNLTYKPKRWVIEKLSIIAAKLSKEGVQFIKDFIQEAKKQIIPTIVKALMESAKG